MVKQMFIVLVLLGLVLSCFAQDTTEPTTEAEMQSTPDAMMELTTSAEPTDGAEGLMYSVGTLLSCAVLAKIFH